MALAYLNGQYLPQADAHLPLEDAGFVFGATVTDLCRTFNHRPFRWPDHLARFRRSCHAVHIPLLLPDEELTHIADRLIAHNAALVQSEQDLALVLFATPGPIGYYAGKSGGPGDGRPTLGMHTFPLPFARHRRLMEKGAHLVVPPTRHVPAASIDPRVKHRSRLHWWLAEQEAHLVEPGATALLMDAQDNLTETAAANFLLVKQGVVISPPSHAILEGISLQTVRELCGELKISFEEKSLRLCDALTADEAFLSNTAYCLACVSRVNGVALPWPGPIYQRLLEAWSARVGVDIRRQIFSSP
jgi:branched-subunit amino acid aminotransferase/4-amino-4-deoxychorismate lyase